MIDQGRKKTLANKIKQKADKAFSAPERYAVQRTWEKIARYVLQSSDGNFNEQDKTKGTTTNQEVYDSSASTFCRDLASAIHSTLTNPAMKWSKFKFKDERLNSDDEAIRWLDACSDRIHSFLNDSNFDNQIGAAYLSFAGLGTMCLILDEALDGDRFKGFKFKSLHLGQVALENNSDGIIDTLYRKFKLNVRQAAEMFPDEEEYQRLQKNNYDQEIEFIQAIFPRPKNEVKLNDVGLAPEERRPIADVYIDCQRSVVVKERGYYEVAFFAPRWTIKPEETYGFGPGQISMPDILTLNKLRKEMLKGLAKAVNPPIITTQRNMINGDFRPGGQVQVRDMNGFKEMQTTTRFDVALNIIEDLKNSIKACFYIDKLMLPPRTETGEMTAYEVAQRLEQMQQILGPVISRLNSELLNPMILRCFKILLRNGQLPEAPAILRGQNGVDIDIAYVNSLARSQQTAELRNIQTWLMEVGQMAQLQAAAAQSSVLDSINFDDLVSYAARIRSIPESAVRSEKEVEAMRKQREQQAQLQQALQMGEQGANIAKNLQQPGLKPNV